MVTILVGTLVKWMHDALFNKQFNKRFNKRSSTYKLVYKLSDFVRKTCELYGRDPPHGWEHMNKVAENAECIFKQTVEIGNFNYCLIHRLVLVCAWLHDVPDHKYDKDGNLETACRHFLKTELSYDDDFVNLIMNIISRVSFSKENKDLIAGKESDWVEVLGPIGCLVRDIVSDADKTEAIGEIGIKRCALYSAEKYAEKHNTEIGRTALKKNIIDHSDEKLFRLYTEFIRTDAGKILAKPHFDRMLDILNNLDEFLDEME